MVLDRFARPEAPQQEDGFLEVGAPIAISHAERLPLGRAPDPGNDHEEEPATAQLVDLGELFGQEHRIPADRDDVRPQLEPRSHSCGEGKADHRVDIRCEGYVGEPDGVEAPPLQPLDE